jgi:integrase
MTLDQLATAYLDARPASTAQAWNLVAVRRMFGSKNLTHINSVNLSRYRRERRENISDGSLRRELGALKACLAWGRRQRLHAVDLPEIELPPEGAPRTRVLTLAEEAEVRAIALNTSGVRLSRLARFTAIGLDCGARKAAIETLEWRQVDMVKGFIDFDLPGRAKSVKRRAKAPVPPRLKPLLLRAWDERDGPYVLDHAGDIRKPWATAFRGTAHANLHPHDLRRTFITLAIEAGVNIEAVARIVGDNPATLRKHYQHHQPQWMQDEMQKRWGT